MRPPEIKGKYCEMPESASCYNLPDAIVKYHSHVRSNPHHSATALNNLEFQNTPEISRPEISTAVSSNDNKFIFVSFLN
jgi:hypothetical protein